MNIQLCPMTSQPKCQTWLLRCLHKAHAITLGAALECSTACTYSSALISYLLFCDSHNFSCKPTPDTLSFFVVYMCHHIKPTSVASYLSGICSELEVVWPKVHAHHNSKLVSHTLAGCMKLFRTPQKGSACLWRVTSLSFINPFPLHPAMMICSSLLSHLLDGTVL